LRCGIGIEIPFWESETSLNSKNLSHSKRLSRRWQFIMQLLIIVGLNVKLKVTKKCSTTAIIFLTLTVKFLDFGANC
jgi:hypothetical protein